MNKTILLCAMLFCIPMSSSCNANEQTQSTPVVIQQLLGSPVYIQIFKEERLLELYAKVGNEFRLVNSFPICAFSGGLGPKRRQGDLKSPEGFYSVDIRHLKPDSQYYRAINIGFPNEYDKAHGYSGSYLMIHGDCKSIGCYAMTNDYMAEIYRYVEAAFVYGQSRISINIYPFRMTKDNLERHRLSKNIDFWRELKPGYDHFLTHRHPPMIDVVNGQYVLSQPVMSSRKPTQYASTADVNADVN